MSLKSFLNDKVVPVIMKFVNLKGVIALKDGMLYTLPLTLVGSVFLLLAQLPYEPLNVWLAKVLGEGWTDPLWQAYGASFSLVAIFATAGIAYTYAKNEGVEPLSAAIISQVTFFILIRNYVITENGEKVGNVLPKNWMGGTGMVTSIIIGLAVGFVYSWFIKKNIKIKMPAGVPEGVCNSFAALIPAGVIMISATALYAVLNWGMNTTFVELIYKIIQTPLQGMTDSVGGVIVMGLLVPFFWWFGIHGANIVTGVMSGILSANMFENQAIIDSGRELTIANGAHVVTQQLFDQFMTTTGSGMTIGLVVGMLFFAKSAQYKQLGKLSIAATVFNINEPIIFGTPIVMNPFMAIPFMITPVVSGLIAYFAISTGIVPPFSGVQVPWTTPPIISTFLLSGWKMSVLQIVVLIVSFFIYFPFFKKQDAINLKNEQAMAENNQ